MTVSVVVPTYNGANKIPNLLYALERQTVTPLEVIIISDGSTDNTTKVIEQTTWQLNIVFIQQENKGRSATRNKGASIANGDLLLFFDDDMRPLQDCIAIHTAHHNQHPDSIVTGGLKEEITPRATELFKYKSFLSDKWLNPLKSETSTLLNKNQVFVTTANFSVSKKTFDQIGGFDERLTDAEDYDFAVRAFKMGIPLYFNNTAFAWHDDNITTQSYIRRQRQYAAAQEKLRAIHPEWLQEGFLKQPYKPEGIKAAIFKLFCSRWWVKSLDKQRLAWLPQSLRYRIYDYVITANGVFFPKKVSL